MTETKTVAVERPSQKRARKPAATDPLRHGFYTPLFTADEISHLDAGPASIQDEKNLLRIKIRRLARLIPLKKIDAKELEALIKLVRVVAVLDALERTDITARKVDGAGSPLLEALADLDPEDL